MSKLFFCANCGQRLNVFRKAMPKFGKIVELVEFHECSEEPVDFDMTPEDIPVYAPKEGKDKFVQKLNELQPPSVLNAMSSFDLRDRRSDLDNNVSSIAPKGILDLINTRPSSPAAFPLEDIDDEES